MGPAGGSLAMSAGDLVRFGRMFLDRGRDAAGGVQVLSESAVDTMQTPQIVLPTRLMGEEWCVGPYRKTWDGVPIFGHSGTNVGGSSIFAVATLVNVASQGYPFAARIFQDVLPGLFGIQPPAAPDPLTPHHAGNENLSRYAGRYEALGISFTIVERNGVLYAIEDNDVARQYGSEALIETELLALGDSRFLPRNAASSGNRLWDVAFWGDDGGGRPTHYLNGIFAYRRTA
jgi:CubicO group peptidase (beta-lactamase class C family)